VHQPAPVDETHADTAREKAAAAHREAVERQRRRRIAMGLALAVLAVAATVGGVAAVRTSASSSTQTTTELAGGSGQSATSGPPWPAPTRHVEKLVASAGLPFRMGMAEHYHAHLDVIVDGEPVSVPANLGIDSGSGAMAPLHTHTDDGVIHIEATTKGEVFTLGQLFTEWDVPLTTDQIGGLRAGNENALTAYVDGDAVTGDPAQIQLRPRQEIALVFGPQDQQVDVPRTYDFQGGE
jgi:hypothetical protein